MKAEGTAEPEPTAGASASTAAERIRKIRLLASDVDGTLLTSDHRVLPEVREAFAEAKAAGLTLVLASARSPAALAGVAAEVDHDGAAICFSGGWAGSIDPGRGLVAADEQFWIPRPAALAVAEAALAAGLVPSWHCEQEWLVPGWSPEIESEARITRQTPHIAPRLAEAPEPNKVLLIGPPPMLVALRERLQGSHGRFLDATFSHPNYLEFLPKGADKAGALLRLAARRRIRPEEIAAVGDGENDLGMIRAVGFGVAMENALASVRAAAGWIAASNDEAGVAGLIRLIIRAQRN